MSNDKKLCEIQSNRFDFMKKFDYIEDLQKEIESFNAAELRNNLKVKFWRRLFLQICVN